MINTTGIEDPAVDAAWVNDGNLVLDIAASGEEISRLERIDPGPGTLVLGVGLLARLTGSAPELGCGPIDSHRSTRPASSAAAVLALPGPLGMVVNSTVPMAATNTIGVLLGAAEAHGDAAIGWTMSRLGRVAASPRGSFRNFTNPVRVEFPGGFGRRTAWRFDFADQVTLPGQLGNPVITAYCMDSRVATTALAAIARIPGGATPALALERRRPARG
ncbi:MAG: hypothetical protein R2704_04675 [Microthrixaceae bacterium]